MSEFKINPNDSAYAKPDTRGIAANFGLTKREKLIMDLYVSGITKLEISLAAQLVLLIFYLKK
jgi:hypothetical protein